MQRHSRGRHGGGRRGIARSRCRACRPGDGCGNEVTGAMAMAVV